MYRRLPSVTTVIRLHVYVSNTYIIHMLQLRNCLLYVLVVWTIGQHRTGLDLLQLLTDLFLFLFSLLCTALHIDTFNCLLAFLAAFVAT